MIDQVIIVIIGGSIGVAIGAAIGAAIWIWFRWDRS